MTQEELHVLVCRTEEDHIYSVLSISIEPRIFGVSQDREFHLVHMFVPANQRNKGRATRVLHMFIDDMTERYRMPRNIYRLHGFWSGDCFTFATVNTSPPVRYVSGICHHEAPKPLVQIDCEEFTCNHFSGIM